MIDNTKSTIRSLFGLLRVSRTKDADKIRNVIKKDPNLKGKVRHLNQPTDEYIKYLSTTFKDPQKQRTFIRAATSAAKSSISKYKFLNANNAQKHGINVVYIKMLKGKTPLKEATTPSKQSEGKALEKVIDITREDYLKNKPAAIIKLAATISMIVAFTWKQYMIIFDGLEKAIKMLVEAAKKSNKKTVGQKTLIYFGTGWKKIVTVMIIELLITTAAIKVMNRLVVVWKKLKEKQKGKK